MTDAVFVDTNVLVYSRDQSESSKQPRADSWRKALWRSRAGRLSVQVLQEYYVTVTRKLSPGMPRQRARQEVADLVLWQPVELTPELLNGAWELEDRHQLSYWDALIVAAAQEAECRFLLTEDLQSGARYGDVQVIDPFQVEPEEILEASRRLGPR
jgi:predicted nucleic acid-binding protein